jgi:hypothetical protein
VHHAQHHRVPWPHRDPVHRERSHLGDDGGRVVVAPGARAGDHDHEVRSCRCRADRRGDLLRHVRHHLESVRLAAGGLGLGGEHQ